MGKLEMFRVMREKGTNLIDDLTTGLVNNMQFADRDVLYPAGTAKPGDGVLPEWFYDSFKAPNGNSELDTIHLYISIPDRFPEIGELAMGIGLVEMKHLDKLSELIADLGGIIIQDNNTRNIDYGNTPLEIIRIAIAGEDKAIKGYEAIIDRVTALDQNDTTTYVLGLLSKLISDELLHIKLFEKWLKENA